MESRVDENAVAFSALNLSKKAPSTDQWLFRDISFVLRAPGDRLVIQGPSGVGKTTLLKGLAQLLSFDQGEVRLYGKLPETVGFPYWRSQVLMVPQRVPAMPGTPEEFVETLSHLHSQKNNALLNRAILIASSWGVESCLWQQLWTNLSGGEAHRLLLSVAVAANPVILLLDEPTGSLDPETTQLVEETLCASNSPMCIWRE